MLDDDQIDLWIEILSEAKRNIFALTSSSPTKFLLEFMIDLSLKLKNEFKQSGTFWEDSKNPSIKFLDFADSLGNPKSIKLREFRKPSVNPQLSEYFGELALDLVRIKDLQDLPKDLYSKGKNRQGPSKTNQKVYHYRRRTRLKKQ